MPNENTTEAIHPQVIERLAAAHHVWEISLAQIRPAPWNPPSRTDPGRVRELADSIAVEGQQSPVLLRPIEAELPVRYELVWGHRRYAALQLLGADGPGTLKSFIRDMTEEQAMISSGIENLQREGFSDIEEAEFFRTCSVHYGESAIKILSEKLSVSDRYICKRIEILKLPEAALKLWSEGIWHIGHMEQLLRLGDYGRVAKFIAQGPTNIPVWRLKDRIDQLAIPLHSGRFEKSDCKICRKNSDVQRKLFGSDKDKTKCLDQDCFRQKQQAWFDLNWADSKFNKFGTRTAIIGDYNTKNTGSFSGFGEPQPSPKCSSCQHFATILNLQGELNYDSRKKVCLGKSNCYSAVKASNQKAEKSDKGGKAAAPDAPRVAWHGEFFRQQFYQQEIPALMANLSADDPRRLQIALATLSHSARSLHDWFCERHGIEVPKKKHNWEPFTLSFDQILQVVKGHNAWQAELLIAQVLVKIALQPGRGYETTFTDRDRQALAEFLDIDFARFQVTEEYLEKKTKAEIIRFIAHDSGLATESAFLSAMSARCFASLEKLAAAKKPHLVELLLQCGVDLHGRLPQEIAARPKLEDK